MKPLYFLGLVVLAAFLFVLFPEIDLAFSALFYRAGDGFYLRYTVPVYGLYKAVPLITYGTILGVIGGLVARLSPGLGKWRIRPRVAAYVLLSLALGPGLIANTVLKDNLGRARPSQITEFGGKAAFTPALIPTDQCKRNCSFVSGHATLGFFVVSFAFLVGRRRARHLAIAGALALGSVIGLGRVIQGAHFLSDAIFAGLLAYGVAWALHHWLVAANGPAGAPEGSGSP